MSRLASLGSSLKAAAQSVFPSGIWLLLRRLRLKWTVATFRRRIVEHVYAGSPLRILIADPMARDWYDMDWPEPPVVELVRGHRLRDGARVFDLGAHQGVLALILAKSVGPSGSVVALEPMPFNAEVARRNRDLNDAPQLTIRQAAVGETNGRLSLSPSFNAAVNEGAGAWGGVEVEAVTIDELSRRYGAPDVLFIDIEGFECRALRGAAETLSRRPDCVVETHVGRGLEALGGSFDDLLRFFPTEAFDLFIAAEWKTSESDSGYRRFDPADTLVTAPYYLVALGRPRPS